MFIRMSLDKQELLLFNWLNFYEKVSHNFCGGYQFVVEFACYLQRSCENVPYNRQNKRLQILDLFKFSGKTSEKKECRDSWF